MAGLVTMALNKYYKKYLDAIAKLPDEQMLALQFTPDILFGSDPNVNLYSMESIEEECIGDDGKPYTMYTPTFISKTISFIFDDTSEEIMQVRQSFFELMYVYKEVLKYWETHEMRKDINSNNVTTPNNS